MFPDWVARVLEGQGLVGVVLFVSWSSLVAAVVYIRSMQAKADKVYGYRLAERDTLNKTLSDTVKALSDMSEVTEDRNDLTEEQAKLIAAQVQSLELLKITILSQYDHIRDHNSSMKDYHNGTAQAVSAMADSIRVLTAIVMENRTIALSHVVDVRKELEKMGKEIADAIRGSGASQTVQMKSLLGGVTITKRRRVSK